MRESGIEEEDEEYEENPFGSLRIWDCELHLIQMGWRLLGFLDWNSKKQSIKYALFPPFHMFWN